MPLKRILDESQSFGPKEVAILLKAYDSLVADLRLKTLPEKERAAKVILGLAKGKTELDAATLQDRARLALGEYETDPS
jgi:hypothetical protein